jgi:hypothetical protein
VSTTEHRARGRPGLLPPGLADALVTQVRAGLSPDEAAQVVGLGPRTLRRWRARAYSRAPEDAEFVSLERRLQAGRLAAARSLGPPWQEVAARLDRLDEYPFHEPWPS